VEAEAFHLIQRDISSGWINEPPVLPYHATLKFLVLSVLCTAGISTDIMVKVSTSGGWESSYVPDYRIIQQTSTVVGALRQFLTYVSYINLNPLEFSLCCFFREKWIATLESMIGLVIAGAAIPLAVARQRSDDGADG
jgi:hypothetical protein